MPRTNSIKLRYGPVQNYYAFPTTYPSEKKHYYDVPFFDGTLSSLSLYGSYIKIQLSSTTASSAPLVAGDIVYVNIGGSIPGFATQYEVVSFDQINNFIVVSNSTIYAALVGGATAGTTGTVTAYDYFYNQLTGITASSGSVRFNLSITDFGNGYTQSPLKYGPAIGDTVTLRGVLATPNTFNFNTYYTVTYVDVANNYFLATNASANSALTSGVVADITTQANYIYVCRLKEGELAYLSSKNEFIYNKLSSPTYNTGYSRHNTKSGPIKFVAGVYYYPPCNQGNLSVTLQKNVQYFIPFVVPNKTTFSTASLSTKNNTSTNIQFGIYDSIASSGMPSYVLAAGGGTSAVTWNLDSAAAGMTSPNGDGYYGSYRKTTGIELDKGLYYLVILDAGATGSIAVNAGVGIGIVKDSNLNVFNPVGSFLESISGATTIDGAYQTLTSTQAVPYVAMRSV